MGVIIRFQIFYLSRDLLYMSTRVFSGPSAFSEIRVCIVVSFDQIFLIGSKTIYINEFCPVHPPFNLCAQIKNGVSDAYTVESEQFLLKNVFLRCGGGLSRNLLEKFMMKILYIFP